MGFLGRKWPWLWILGAVCWTLATTPARAQTQHRLSAVPTLNGGNQEPAEELSPPAFTSAVSLIDSMFPKTQVRVRVDAAFHANLPQRAEYIWAKGGFPGTPGPPLPEKNLSYTELSSHIEYAIGPWFSVFLESPTRWMNPEVNGNSYGYGDTNLGFKFMCYAGESLQLSLQLRGYLPTGREPTLGTHHYTVEPALLGHWQILPYLQLEGEFRYWAPLGGTDFAGDILRYGLGISYGQRSAGEMWVMPVLEAVGWTALNGQTFTGDASAPLAIQSAARDTIVNVQGGLRWGMGERGDIYTGYGRAVTNDRWYRDYFRLEVRLLF